MPPTRWRRRTVPLFKGCVAFYRELFRSRDGNAPFRAMNDTIDPSETAFASIPAEAAFKARYRNLRRDLCSEWESRSGPMTSSPACLTASGARQE